MSILRPVVLAAAAAFVITATPGPVVAGPIERACNQSDRRAASRSLCNCIGHVADQLLTRGEQRQAAKFFNDPHRAQETRMSDRQSDEVFWQRYKQFGSIATQRCS
ncbi:MAG: hypothetical protein AAGH83_01810 [Pseudomonadota bacterium]